MIFYIILYIILTVSGLVLMKIGLMQTNLSGLSELLKNVFNIKFLLIHWQYVLGMICYATSFLTWMFLLSKKDLSFIYPLTIGIIYVLIMFSSVIIFHEHFTIYKIIGTILIGLGILFLIK